MIGEKVPREELEKLLKEEEEKTELARELSKELKEMRSGECLLYRVPEGAEKLTSLAFTLSHDEGVEIFTRPGKIYAYKRGGK
ncbi:unnamed protein product [marine sediment metagenome]|uniref:Uncharacterized protein n=1 Tax=marine sediment metagenome TaxID=412755 RepID=X1GZ40_9ZZZZ